ncbi:hypothetical protein K2173_004722 [Erythroxylum novogranatense]|uniref:RNA exonuclease 4 n=1 Tax=Erythroxylum novogranatense TaxID=1862640 RepID=A0AAV8UC46_9ROSI|nr:hypothetical protein K2173_004722 [Erythroxylum novogranatense]
MDVEAQQPTKAPATRHKCSACYKQFTKKEHLVEHMKISYHSPHQPQCGVCRKHCKSFESLREHLTGKLAKTSCSTVYSQLGCNLCLKVFESPTSLSNHKGICCLSAPGSLATKMLNGREVRNDSQLLNIKYTGEGTRAVAIDCEMVGGGSDGSVDLCARVCLVDEDENVILCTYVQPQSPITNYRHEITGLTAEHLKDAVPVKQVQNKILEILYTREFVGRQQPADTMARLLVGHDLKHDLDCLRMDYPRHLLRDTAKYRPLMKTNLVSHSLKYLIRTYLGYDIQKGIHDPYEDCVSVMRLYKRLCAQDHQMDGNGTEIFDYSFDLWKHEELQKMTPDELYKISKLDYICWCSDSKPAKQPCHSS